MDGQTYTQLDTAECDFCRLEKKSTRWIKRYQDYAAACTDCVPVTLTLVEEDK